MNTKIQKLTVCFVATMLFAITRGSATPPHDLRPIFNQTIGYQLGYTTNSRHFMQAIDFSGVLMLFNYGLQHQFGYDTKAFVGLGIFDALKVQYGYAFNANSNLLRIRSDWYVCTIMSHKSKKYFDNSISTVGLFFEKGFNGNYKGYAVGVTVALSVWDIHYYGKKWICKN